MHTNYLCYNISSHAIKNFNIKKLVFSKVHLSFYFLQSMSPSHFYRQVGFSCTLNFPYCHCHKFLFNVFLYWNCFFYHHGWKSSYNCTIFNFNRDTQKWLGKSYETCSQVQQRKFWYVEVIIECCYELEKCLT